MLSEASNFLKRFPRLWRILMRIYGIKRFNPAQAHYRKSFDLPLNDNTEEQKLNIIFDAQCLQTPTRKRGIGRYSISLIEAVCREKPDMNFGVLLTTLANKSDFSDAVLELEALNLPNLNIIVCDPFKNKKKVNFIQAQELLESFLLKFEPSAVITLGSFEKLNSVIPTTHNQSFTRLAILYDLIPLQYKRDLLVSNFQMTSYNWALSNLSKAECLLSISRESETVWRNMVSKDSKIKVIYGAGYRATKPPRSNSNVVRSGILCIGAEQKHKNIVNLIHAYSLFQPNFREKHELTVLGIHSNGARARLKKFATSRNVSVNFTSFLTNQELNDAYGSNKLLVMPSLVEGLSMPILEAWEMGLPVVGSAGTVAEELIVDSELLFDPNDVTSIAATVQNVLTDDIAWQRAAASTSKKVSHYSWQNTAKLLLEAVSEETNHV